MRIAIIIPAYNASQKIGEVIDDLRKSGYTTIVGVDDGSTDNTFQIMQKKGIAALQHCTNRGQGAALRTGFRYAFNTADVFVTFDADGQHQAKDIKKLLKPLQEGLADAALGSRFLDNKTRMPFIRCVFLKGGAFMIWMMYGIKLTDSHNGLRALSKDAVRKIKITSDRFEHASELLEQLHSKGIRYCEIPVEIKYTAYSRQKGQSTWNAFRILFKMIFNKFMR